jgi:alkaline phosphatase D
MKNLTEEEIEKYNYFLSSSILGSEGARALNNYFKNKTNIPTAEEILFKDSIEKIQSFNSDDKMSVILRLNSYFEKIEESRMIEIIDNSQHKLIAKKIKELSAVLPRDAVFSVLRNLNFLVENNKGLKKAFYDKLLEEIAITLGDEKWLEEV